MLWELVTSSVLAEVNNRHWSDWELIIESNGEILYSRREEECSAWMFMHDARLFFECKFKKIADEFAIISAVQQAVFHD